MWPCLPPREDGVVQADSALDEILCGGNLGTRSKQKVSQLKFDFIRMYELLKHW